MLRALMSPNNSTGKIHTENRTIGIQMTNCEFCGRYLASCQSAFAHKSHILCGRDPALPFDERCENWLPCPGPGRTGGICGDTPILS